jgi:hypothetical protein
VLRVYPSGDYMPAGGRVEIRKDGTWQALDFDIGGQKGERREIAAYLVGPGGRALLDYYKEAASIHGVARRQLVDMGKAAAFLPLIIATTPDMLKCDSVHVVRG